MAVTARQFRFPDWFTPQYLEREHGKDVLREAGKMCRSCETPIDGAPGVRSLCDNPDCR